MHIWWLLLDRLGLRGCRGFPASRRNTSFCPLVARHPLFHLPIALPVPLRDLAGDALFGVVVARKRNSARRWISVTDMLPSGNGKETRQYGS